MFWRRLRRHRTNRSKRKHLRAVFIELNRRGPWTPEEKRGHVRRIRSAVLAGANGFDLLPRKRQREPYHSPKPEPQPRPYAYRRSHNWW